VNEKHKHGGHDEHQANREKHKADSQAAMAKETTVEGRMKAFCHTQINYFKTSTDQIVAALKAGMSVDDAAAIIHGDIAHYEENVDEVAAGVAHGIKD
jgi:hypothetical protein